MKMKPARIVGAFVVVNCLLFAVYRLLFLEGIAGSRSWDHSIQVLLKGFRLDAALLGIELGLLCLLALAVRRIPLRSLFCSLWLLTSIHGIYCTINTVFFAERNQHVGEMLIAYITSPLQIYLATMPFIKGFPLFSLAAAAAVTGSLWLGARVAKRFTGHLTLTHRKRHITLTLFVAALFFSLAAMPVTVKKNRAARGWQLKFLRSNFVTNLDNFALNQAIINPFHELLFIQIPAGLKKKLPYTLDRDNALKITQNTLGLKDTAPEYPLLRTVESPPVTGIENIVVIQAEGLTDSVFRYGRNGRKVMPHLNQMAAEGLYFPHTYQSFNATAGSVFSTATSFHKICFDEKTRRFTSSELSGYYGSLAHVLGSENYNHYFFEGFRQSASDFLRFMGNQGYTTYGYGDLKKRLGKYRQETVTEGDLGIHDEFFMKESAEILLQSGKNFTAHLITATSHSPWKVPPGSDQAFDTPALNAFAYLDASIKTFVETLGRDPERFRKTLIVVVADHTSFTFGNDVMERIRIPLIFFHPGNDLKSRVFSTKRVASHVDILPSVLDLLGGKHPYSGMGTSLFSQNAPAKGVISGTRSRGFYIKDDFILEYRPFEKDLNLFQISGDSVHPTDLSDRYPHVLKTMRLEYLAQYETAKRLSFNRQVFPLQVREQTGHKPPVR